MGLAAPAAADQYKPSIWTPCVLPRCVIRLLDSGDTGVEASKNVPAVHTQVRKVVELLPPLTGKCSSFALTDDRFAKKGMPRRDIITQIARSLAERACSPVAHGGCPESRSLI